MFPASPFIPWLLDLEGKDVIGSFQVEEVLDGEVAQVSVYKVPKIFKALLKTRRMTLGVVAKGLKRAVDQVKDVQQWDIAGCLVEEIASTSSTLAAQKAAFLQREKNLLEKLEVSAPSPQLTKVFADLVARVDSSEKPA